MLMACVLQKCNAFPYVIVKEDAESRRIKELAIRLQGDEEEAQEALRDLLALFGGQIAWALKSRFLGQLTEEDIKDVLSIWLYKIWQKRWTLDTAAGNVGALFHKIARNIAIDMLRTRRLVEVPFTEGYETASAESEPEQQWPLNQVQTELLRIFALLSDREKLVLEANTRDWSEALAKELGISSGALRVLRYRTLRKIRRELESKGKTP